MTVRKIFMPCAFTWGNKGDAALLIAAAQAIRQQWPEAELSFQSFTPVLDAAKYRERFVAMPINPGGKLNWAIHWVPGLSPLILAAACLLVLGYLSFRRAVFGLLGLHGSVAGLFGWRALVEEIRGADVVVAMPGGYLQATVWGDDYWLLHWLTLRIVVLERKPLVIYAQSVGPFVGPHRWFAKALLRHVDLVMVREQFSARRMEALGVPAVRLRVVPDAAFALSDTGASHAEIDHLLQHESATGNPLVGVSVRSHHFPGLSDPAQAMERYLDEVAAAADHLIDVYGARVLFVPQCIGIGGNDLHVSERVRQRMKRPNESRIITEDLSPLALQSLYGRLRLLVGTRMHANILALCAGTPVVAISYERKTDGIMERLGLGAFVLDIASIQGRLVEAVQAAMDTSADYRSRLAIAIPEIRAEAQRTPALIAERFGI